MTPRYSLTQYGARAELIESRSRPPHSPTPARTADIRSEGTKAEGTAEMGDAVLGEMETLAGR